MRPEAADPTAAAGEEPDVQRDHDALRYLIALCFGSAPAIGSDAIPWARVIAAAGQHGVRTQLWKSVASADLPEDCARELRAVYGVTRMINRRMEDELGRIEAGLAGEQIAYWPMKGPRLTRKLYDDIGARELSDLDLLIRPEDLDRVDGVLRAHGFGPWRSYRKPRFVANKELLYVKREGNHPELCFDLHQRLLSFVLDDPLAAEVRQHGWTETSKLAYLCVHQVAHRFARLRYALDVHQYLRVATEIDWCRFNELIGQTRYGPGVWFGLSLQNGQVPGSVPTAVLRGLRPSGPRVRALELLAGADLITVLARGRSLRGPWGTLLMLASATGLGTWRRHLHGWMFPSIEDLHLAYGDSEPRSLARLYLRRFASKAHREPSSG